MAQFTAVKKGAAGGPTTPAGRCTGCWRRSGAVTPIGPCWLLAAALCVPLDLANEYFPWELPLTVQAVLGGLAITGGELLAGLVLNVWLGLGIWDYDRQWGNLWGQVCPLYTGLWCLLAGPVIVGFDWLDYWLCGGERPRYKLI